MRCAVLEFPLAAKAPALVVRLFSLEVAFNLQITD